MQCRCAWAARAKRHASYNGVQHCGARLGAAGLGDARTVPPEHCGIEYPRLRTAWTHCVAAAARGLRLESLALFSQAIDRRPLQSTASAHSPRSSAFPWLAGWLGVCAGCSALSCSPILALAAVRHTRPPACACAQGCGRSKSQPTQLQVSGREARWASVGMALASPAVAAGLQPATHRSHRTVVSC